MWSKQQHNVYEHQQRANRTKQEDKKKFDHILLVVRQAIQTKRTQQTAQCKA